MVKKTTAVEKKAVVQKTPVSAASHGNAGAKGNWWKLSPAVTFILFVVVAAFGYVIGVNHYQLEGLIEPALGVKASSQTLDLSSVQRTYQALVAHYDGKLDKQALVTGANKGLVAAVGDQFTVYFDKQDASDFNNDLSGNIGGGIGAEVGLRNGAPTITGLLDGDPAKAAGLQTGDVISKVNGKSTEGLDVDTVVGQIRGDIGTKVTIEVLRGGQPQDFTITRAAITAPSVTSSVKNGIGILTISRFDDTTGDETGQLALTAAENFKKQNVKGVILDLRDNGGGYLTAAPQVAGLWLSNKTIVSEKTGSITVDSLKSSGNAPLKGIPTVVLVNGNTASASEIVTGALQDYGVAKVVGTQTYGKGSVQQLLSLSGGAQLKVTVAKWYTPKGKNINQQGITPDKKVADPTQTDFDAGQDPQMDAALQLLGA